MRGPLRAASILCALPAIQIGFPAVIPTFVPGCQLVPPRVTSVYTGEGRPIPRERYAQVGVFLLGNSPPQRYVVVGQVQVVTTNRNTSLYNMIDYARREARKLGGDAIVDVWPRAVDGEGHRILTAKIVTWQHG